MFSEFSFSLSLCYKLIVSTESHKICVKISPEFVCPHFAFSTTVHSNFEDLPAETLSILCAFPFVNLSTYECYDWSSEINQ